MDYFDYDDLTKRFSVVTYEEFVDLVSEFKDRQRIYGFPSDTKHKKGANGVETFYKALEEMNNAMIFGKSRIGKDTSGGDILFCVPNCPEKDNDRFLGGSQVVEKKYKDRELTWFKRYKKGKRHFFNAADAKNYELEDSSFSTKFVRAFLCYGLL